MHLPNRKAVAQALLSLRKHKWKTSIIGLLVIALIMARALSPIKPEIIGTLPRADISSITDLIRDDMRSYTSLDLPWDNLTRMPSALRRHFSRKERIAITVKTHDSVEVKASVIRGALDGYGRFYMLKKGSQGWEISSWSDWYM